MSAAGGVNWAVQRVLYVTGRVGCRLCTEHNERYLYMLFEYDIYFIHVHKVDAQGINT